MKPRASHLARVRRAVLLGLSAAAETTWVRLNAYCLSKGNRGRIPEGAAWTEATWAVVGLPIAAVDELVHGGALVPDGDDLVLVGYDHHEQHRLDHADWLEARRGRRQRERDEEIVVIDLPADEPAP